MTVVAKGKGTGGGVSFQHKLKGVVPQGRRSSVFLFAACDGVVTAPVSIPTSVFMDVKQEIWH